jgi:hypothetical protein
MGNDGQVHGPVLGFDLVAPDFRVGIGISCSPPGGVTKIPFAPSDLTSLAVSTVSSVVRV